MLISINTERLVDRATSFLSPMSAVALQVESIQATIADLDGQVATGQTTTQEREQALHELFAQARTRIAQLAEYAANVWAAHWLLEAPNTDRALALASTVPYTDIIHSAPPKHPVAEVQARDDLRRLASDLEAALRQMRYSIDHLLVALREQHVSGFGEDDAVMYTLERLLETPGFFLKREIAAATQEYRIAPYFSDSQRILDRNAAQRWWEQVKVPSDAIPYGTIPWLAGDIPVLVPEHTDASTLMIHSVFPDVAQEMVSKPRRFHVTPRALAHASVQTIIERVQRWLCDDPNNLDEQSPSVGATWEIEGGPEPHWSINVGPYLLILPDAALISRANHQRLGLQEAQDDDPNDDC